MEHLRELALSKYQNHLSIINHLFILNTMSADAYQQSRQSATRLWHADIEMIKLLEKRQIFINEVAQ